MEKRNNVLVVIFVITTIIAGCLAVYFGLALNKSKQELDLANNTVKNISDSIPSELNTVEKKETVSEIIKYKAASIDVNKCLNPTEGFVYKERISVGALGVTCTLNDDRKSVTIGINSDSIKQYYNIDREISNGNYESITINNFNGEISDIVYGSLSGQAVGYEVFLFLMNDGTVEYIPVYQALKYNIIKSFGKVDELNNIVKITSISVLPSTEEIYGGGISLAAVKEDGSFYNIYDLIYEEFKF